DYTGAVKLLNEAVKLDPDFALAHAQLSRAHSNLYWTLKTQTHLNKAKEAVDKARGVDPDLPEVHLALGHYYYHGHRKDEDALDEFDIVLKAQPSNDEALAFTCYVQRKQGKVEEALASIRRASEINPVNRTWAMDIPELLIYLKRFSEAAEACDRAVRLFPGRPHPYRVKAWVCLYRDGNTVEARRVLEEASKTIESWETEYVDILATLEVFDRNYDKALERLPSTGDVGGPFLPRVLRIALIHGYMDNAELAKKYYEEARKRYDSGIDEGPEDSKGSGVLGIAYAGLGLREEAKREADLLEKSMSVNRDAFFNPKVKKLAYVYLLLGDHEKAIDQLYILLTKGSQWSVPFVRNDPTWEPLHKYPRFQKLVGLNK
ncbi:MAG: hypothetical protein AMJ65_07670, partial [Phycisphaerae bacterium SG8_4]